MLPEYLLTGGTEGMLKMLSTIVMMRCTNGPYFFFVSYSSLTFLFCFDLETICVFFISFFTFFFQAALFDLNFLICSLSQRDMNSVQT